jgi:hypothetical protein
MNLDKIASLHSRYNPQGEAQRYIDSLSLSEKIRFFILIEPGLGYMTAPLKRKAPNAKVIALHAEKPSYEPKVIEPKIAADSEWYPETGVSVQEFLEAEIPDSQASEIRLLEWRPALNVYGHLYLNLVEEAAAFIRRSDANARTTKAFGSRWFKNFLKNLSIIKTAISPVSLANNKTSLPLLVTGAGPGLEDAIPIIKKISPEAFFILASSSSVAALDACGLSPDLAISTDGSNWAKLHLFGSFRNNSKKKEVCPIAAALTAALPSQCGDLPILVISDGSFWQTLILRELQIPFVALPQRGTVTAAALDLAFALTGGQIYIAGMDLGNRDIRSHARPYSFDTLIEEKASRANPAYSQTYRRSSLLKAGGSYGIYASWFEKQLSLYPRPLSPIGKNNSIFDSIAFPSFTDKQEPEAAIKFNRTSLGFITDPSERAISILEAALKNPVSSKTLQKELEALLLPDSGDLSENDLVISIIDAIHSTTGLSHGENNGQG